MVAPTPGPFYDSLCSGLPRCLHRAFVETLDFEDALAWLESGELPSPLVSLPAVGQACVVEARLLIEALGVSSSGLRWVRFRRCRYEVAARLLARSSVRRFDTVVRRLGEFRAAFAVRDPSGVRRFQVSCGVLGGVPSVSSLALYEQIGRGPARCRGDALPDRRAVSLRRGQRDVLALLVVREFGCSSLLTRATRFLRG